jgi:hypothetical protein
MRHDRTRSASVGLALEIRQFLAFLESHEREYFLAHGGRAGGRANNTNKLSCSPGAQPSCRAGLANAPCVLLLDEARLGESKLIPFF